MKAGFHNHQLEFKPIDGKRPMEVLAENTPKDVMPATRRRHVHRGGLRSGRVDQCESRANQFATSARNGRRRKAYEVLFAEGVAPWKQIFAAAEKTGGVQFYYIEQEGYDLPPFETAEKCLANFKKLRGEA